MQYSWSGHSPGDFRDLSVRNFLQSGERAQIPPNLEDAISDSRGDNRVTGVTAAKSESARQR